MTFRKLLKGRALYQTPDRIWVAKGLTFFAVDYSGKRVTPKYHVGGILDRIIGSFRLSRQLLRVGLHHLLPLANGNVLVTSKRITYIVDPEGKVISTFTDYQGNKPGHQGVYVTPDGAVFFGEYHLNPKRDKEIRLFRSIDNGVSFHVVKTFAAGEIRHIHFIKWDRYRNCLWMGTGDKDEENMLLRSDDNGLNWSLIGCGSQDWRAIGVCCIPEGIIWGTDAGHVPDTVHLVKMQDSNKIKVLEDFEGPCHGCASYADGRVFLSTGVEGGENELDRFARLKEYKNEATNEICRLKKDFFPYLVQYGVMRFPLGTENCNIVVFTCMGLKRHGETVMIEDKV